jgi:hypothetical protein
LAPAPIALETAVVITVVSVRGRVPLQHSAEGEASKAPTLVHNSTTFFGHKKLKKAETELSDLVWDVLAWTPHPDAVELPVDVETVGMVGGRGLARPGVEHPGHQRVSGNAGWRDASPDGSSAEEDVTVLVGDRGGGVDQTAMNGGFKRLPDCRPESARMNPPNVILMSTIRLEGGDKCSVGHKVLSHLVKPVAPSRLLDEVEPALGSGEQI